MFFTLRLREKRINGRKNSLENRKTTKRPAGQINKSNNTLISKLRSEKLTRAPYENCCFLIARNNCSGTSSLDKPDRGPKHGRITFRGVRWENFLAKNKNYE